MCDTMVALGGTVAGGGTLFAKNSDRQPNEAQNLDYVPRRRHRPGASLKLTYIEIPEVRETAAVMLSRPFWIWGAEMGANEHGVVIGNEAVFARLPSGRKPGLIGMDLLRLGLERGNSARHALDTMLELLERYGQSGNCGHRRRQFYDNSFIIADAHQAFVLESFGRHWAVEEVASIRTISNALSITTGHSRTSAGLAELARSRGWFHGRARLDFAASFADPQREAPGQGRARCARSAALLSQRNARLKPADMMRVLRDHGADAGSDWRPDLGQQRSICMHAHPAIGRRGQTTAAWVAELQSDRALHWVTAGAAPCSAIFRPLLLEHGLPADCRAASDRFDRRARWWRHERLHRALLADYPARLSTILDERAGLETTFRKRMQSALADRSPAAGRLRKAAIAECWREADLTEERWIKDLASSPIAAPADPAYRRAWGRLNRLAGFPSVPPPRKSAAALRA